MYHVTLYAMVRPAVIEGDDVERDHRRRDREGAVEDVDQGGRQAPHLDARGRVLQPAHSGLRTQVAPALRRPADGQLEQWVSA